MKDEAEQQDGDGDVVVPALALHLLQASMSSTQATVDSLALMAWEQVRDLAHEALTFYHRVDKAASTVTTRELEYTLRVAPMESWAQTHSHARSMVESMGGTNPAGTW